MKGWMDIDAPWQACAVQKKGGSSIAPADNPHSAELRLVAKHSFDVGCRLEEEAGVYVKQ